MTTPTWQEAAAAGRAADAAHLAADAEQARADAASVAEAERIAGERRALRAAGYSGPWVD